MLMSAFGSIGVSFLSDGTVTLEVALAAANTSSPTYNTDTS